MREVSSSEDYAAVLSWHFVISALLTIVLFLIWHVTDSAYWWWWYPLPLGFITFSLHKYCYYEKNYLNAYFNVYLVVNFTLFVTNYLGMNEGSYPFPWFVYPWGATTLLLIFLIVKFSEEVGVFKGFVYSYFVFNFLIFFTWLMLKGFPYFLYSCTVFSLPLAIYYAKVKKHENRKWVYTAITGIHIAIISLVTWGLITTIFPWFIFPCAVMIVATAIVFCAEKSIIQEVDI